MYSETVNLEESNKNIHAAPGGSTTGFENLVNEITKPAQSLHSAIVYCEGNFAQIDGKTANGLVRHSEAYRIHSVIDSTQAGQDSGIVLDGTANNIPLFCDLETAVFSKIEVPDTFIYGMAPSTGTLSTEHREVVLDAISYGMNTVSGLHEFLSDDPEIKSAAKAANVSIRDIRKPRLAKDMRLFDGIWDCLKDWLCHRSRGQGGTKCNPHRFAQQSSDVQRIGCT